MVARLVILSNVIFILAPALSNATSVDETCSVEGLCTHDRVSMLQKSMTVGKNKQEEAGAVGRAEEAMAGTCKAKCAKHSKDWTKKCTWRACSGCAECVTTETTPTPTPPTTKQSTYVPGEAGAPWSEEEALIVKAKILQLFAGKEQLQLKFLRDWEAKHGKKYECATGPHWNETCGIYPTGCKKAICMTKPTPPYKNLPAIMLRLGFHDCFKYEDGTGGCDGCLQFGNMFTTMSQTNSIKKRIWPDSSVGGQNNGLQLATDYLEEVYNNVAFPEGAQALGTSLSGSGKSRADLWAFAAMVAAEFGMLDNNMACADVPGRRTAPDIKHLYNFIGQEKNCIVTQKNPPRFFTGRKDCALSDRPTDPLTSSLVPHVARSYETAKAERQANAYWNGTDVANFFRTDFNLNRRETVALMGAHSYGGFGFGNSGFKYTWQWSQSHLLNNNYYRLLSAKPSKFLTKKPWIAVGGPNNALAETGWWLRFLQETTSGGSMLWFHYHRRCPSCLREQNGSWKSYEARGGSYFESDHCCKCNEQDGTEADFDPGCFINVTRDETAIHADLGLYYQFKVTGKNGYMLDYDSCPGLDPKDWTADRLADASLDNISPLRGGIHSWDMPPHCVKNQEKDNEEGSKSMSAMVEEYADDQNAWIADFDQSLEKMTMNGYSESELNLAPVVIGLGKTECAQSLVKPEGAKRKVRMLVCEQIDNGPLDGISPLAILEKSRNLGLSSDKAF